MNTTALITGAIFGILSIILGAFGAHLLKKILTEERLQSFEVGVRYQLYGAFILLIMGFNLDFSLVNAQLAYYGITLGTLLFSGSIYLLSFKDQWKVNLRFLGPITPLGGLLIILGWISLLLSFTTS